MQLYQLLFPNGKSYIGITSKTAKERFKRHCNPAEKQHPCQRAIHKFGKENVKLTVLATVDNWELLCLAEMEAIEKFNTFDIRKGYNLTIGGDGSQGFVMSEKTREKMSITAKKRTDEHKDKISKATTGKKHTEGSLIKISIAAVEREARIKTEKEQKQKQELSDKAAIRVKRLLREWSEIL